MHRNNHNKGQVIILNTILFLAVSLILINGIAYPVISHYSATQSFINSKQTFILADSTLNEALYRIKNGKTITSPLSVTLSSSTAVATITNSAQGKSISVAESGNAYHRNLQMNLQAGTGVSFKYGVQSGQGGFNLSQSSSVTGNIFSAGSVMGGGNTINGNIVSAGPNGLVSGINATGTVSAHTIQNSTVGGDAHYSSSTTLISTTVTGTKYPDSTDIATTSLPISDLQISNWEQDAQAGGTATCSNGTYKLFNTTTTIGPIQIPCDLDIKNSTVTITGPIWVQGNITLEVNPVINMDSSLGGSNVAIIADNPTASSTSGKITISSGATFNGSGTTGSFVFMVSQNDSAEKGGSNKAIDMSQSSSNLVGYAAHGLITISNGGNNNNSQVKAATAYQINLFNSSKITYDTTLPNTVFQSGATGGYTQTEWNEI